MEYEPPAAIAAKPLELSKEDTEKGQRLKTRYNEALPEMRKRFFEYLAGQAKPAVLFEACYRTMNTELALRGKPAEDVAIYKRYVEVVEEVELARYVAERVDEAELDEVRDFRLQLKITWMRAWTVAESKKE